MSKKLTYNFVKEQFEKEGYILLSKEYIDNNSKLTCICNNGHLYLTRWLNFSQGRRCCVCAGLSKLDYSYIKAQFEASGCILLSKNYINSRTKLDYICPKGHTHSITWSDFQQGKRCFICGVANRSNTGSGRWKGGVCKLDLPLYSTYAKQLEKYHKIHLIKQQALELLGVECVYCGKIFVPKLAQVKHRLDIIQGISPGESNIYCSDSCKTACPTYNQKFYPKGFKLATSREVQPELRKLVLARDNYKCQICEAALTEAELHCHHIEPVSQNPIESADVDNCITLCKKHHKQVHALPTCGYTELRCNKII